mmetsp:Transcript_52956/g.94466  ORF Transcript_52956/g.94466 Transcript_52956/m.94466 type:complete len:510 (-) Transcript_52956:1862-3391(-)
MADALAQLQLRLSPQQNVVRKGCGPVPEHTTQPQLRVLKGKRPHKAPEACVPQGCGRDQYQAAVAAVGKQELRQVKELACQEGLLGGLVSLLLVGPAGVVWVDPHPQQHAVQLGRGQEGGGDGRHGDSGEAEGGGPRVGPAPPVDADGDSREVLLALCLCLQQPQLWAPLHAVEELCDLRACVPLHSNRLCLPGWGPLSHACRGPWAGGCERVGRCGHRGQLERRPGPVPWLRPASDPVEGVRWQRRTTGCSEGRRPVHGGPCLPQPPHCLQQDGHVLCIGLGVPHGVGHESAAAGWAGEARGELQLGEAGQGLAGSHLQQDRVRVVLQDPRHVGLELHRGPHVVGPVADVSGLLRPQVTPCHVAGHRHTWRAGRVSLGPRGESLPDGRGDGFRVEAGGRWEAPAPQPSLSEARLQLRQVCRGAGHNAPGRRVDAGEGKGRQRLEVGLQGRGIGLDCQHARRIPGHALHGLPPQSQDGEGLLQAPHARQARGRVLTHAVPHKRRRPYAI